jgi:hypothetical protein
MRFKDVFYAVLLVLATAACPVDSRRGRKQKAASRAEQDTTVGHARVLASSPMDLVQRLREQIDQCDSGLGPFSAAPSLRGKTHHPRQHGHRYRNGTYLALARYSCCLS